MAPGFIALELYRAVNPARERNQFAQLIWSLIYGVLIYSIVKWFDGAHLNHLFQSDKEGFPTFRFIAVLWISGFLVGLGRIFIDYVRYDVSAWHEAYRFIAPDPQSIWAKVNQKIYKDWAVVYLNDGAIYLGWISEYTFNHNSEHQDFLLKNVKCVNEDLSVKYRVDGVGVYLNTKDVVRIEFVKGKKL